MLYRNFAKLLTVCTALGVSAQSSFAQTPSGAVEADTQTSSLVGTGAFSSRAIHFLATRISRLDISGLLPAARNAANHEFKMLAAFSASGALVYNQEFPKRHYNSEGELMEVIPQQDRTQGMQLMPYTVSVLSSGRVMVTAGLLGFRNQNTQDLIGSSNDSKGLKSLAHFVSSADLLVFDYNDQFTFQNLSTRKLKLATINLAFPIAENEKATKVLVLTTGAEASWTQAKLRLQNGETIQIGGGNNAKDFAFNPEINYGIKYDQYQMDKHDGHMQIALNMRQSWLNANFLDAQSPAYLASVNQFRIDNGRYDNDLHDWAIAHNLTAYSMADLESCYGPRPKEPKAETAKIKGINALLYPSITYDRPIRSASSSKGGLRTATGPRVGLDLTGTLPLRSDFKGENVYQKQMEALNSFVTLGAFIKF